MAEENYDSITEVANLGERLTEARIAEVDASYFSPKERADRVNTALELASEELDLPFTRWDYLCFAVEFLGQFVISFFSHDDIILKTSKLVGKWLYNMHYFYPEEIYGPPRKEGKK